MILHIGDKYDRIVDVMNKCFGWNYKACMRGWYVLSKQKKTSVWFPKMADLSGGIPKPGDKWYGWCNTINESKILNYCQKNYQMELNRILHLSNYLELKFINMQECLHVNAEMIN